MGLGPWQRGDVTPALRELFISTGSLDVAAGTGGARAPTPLAVQGPGGERRPWLVWPGSRHSARARAALAWEVGLHLVRRRFSRLLRDVGVGFGFCQAAVLNF